MMQTDAHPGDGGPATLCLSSLHYVLGQAYMHGIALAVLEQLIDPVHFGQNQTQTQVADSDLCSLLALLMGRLCTYLAQKINGHLVPIKKHKINRHSAYKMIGLGNGFSNTAPCIWS
jgi:hypothetical protein